MAVPRGHGAGGTPGPCLGLNDATWSDAPVLREHLGGRPVPRVGLAAGWDVRPRAEDDVQDLLDAGATGLEDELRRYVHTPTVGVGLHWRFDLRPGSR